MNLFLELKNESVIFSYKSKQSELTTDKTHFICFSGVTCEFVVHISGTLVSKCQASNAPA